jgi:outer membrane autotransporter protein
MAERSSNVSLPAPDPISYIRVDIKPQAEIIPGVNHDIIYLTGDDSSYDLTNATILLAPTAPGLTLTDGDYTIIDGVNPLIGFSPDIPVGLLLRNFDSTTTKSGKFVSNLGSGTITYDSVLTNYFTTLQTEDPAITDLEPLGKRMAPAISLPVDTSEFDSNLVVTIVHDYENLPGLTENQSALGSAIDGLADSPDPLIQEFIANLDISNLATVQDTLTLLDPSSSFGLVSSQVNTNYRLHRITGNHLAGIRGSSTQTSSVAPSSKDAKGSIVAGPSSTLTSGRGNAWGSFSYDDQDYDGSPGGSDYDGDTGSFTAGVDWLVAPALVVGVVFDGSKSDYNGEGYDSEVDSFRGAVYGTWGNAMGFYSDALIGFGTADFESRLGSSGILTGNVSNDTSADSFQALWTAGYALGTQQLKHGPFAGFEYQTVSVDGYSQGGPLDIEVDGYDVDSLRALIGYRVDADLGKFSPYASVAYAHEFEDGENTTTATVGGAPFEVAGAEQGSAILLSVGTSVALTKSLSLDVSYRGEIALDDGISSNGVSLGLNYNF